MSHTEEEITRETEGTEEPCCVVGIGASAGGGALRLSRISLKQCPLIQGLRL